MLEKTMKTLIVEHKLTRPRIVHVGAGMGAEVPGYMRLGLVATFIEADEYNATIFKYCFPAEKYPNAAVLVATVSSVHCVRQWHPTNYLACGSVQPLDKSTQYPVKNLVNLPPRPVECYTLDELVTDHAPYHFLVTDVQGHDYEVLQGADRVLSTCLMVCCEVWHKPLYRGTVLLPELRRFLESRNFYMAQLNRGDQPTFYGNAIFLRRK